MAAWAKAKALLDQGQYICIDGGTGTEVERTIKAAGMEHAVDTKSWSGAQVFFHPRECCQVHSAYINAGAKIIIANTYACNRSILEPAGFASEVANINRSAVALAVEAKEAAADPASILIAGTISCHPPQMKNGVEYDMGIWPPVEEEEANFAEQAQLLKEAGVDLIFCEMTYDLDHGRRAVRAALSVGLPVFVCFSCNPSLNKAKPARLGDGVTPVAEATQAMMDLPGASERLAGFYVHHTKIYACLRCLKAVREKWHGPLGCYPDHGSFEMPHWQFNDLPENVLLDAVDGWVKETRVQLIGGCCGMGPSHIEMIARACQKYNDAAMPPPRL